MSDAMPSAATAQSLVEHALSASTADDCIVIVHDHTSANLGGPTTPSPPTG